MVGYLLRTLKVSNERPSLDPLTEQSGVTSNLAQDERKTYIDRREVGDKLLSILPPAPNKALHQQGSLKEKGQVVAERSTVKMGQTVWGIWDVGI
jgi:hypothetical protein